MTTRILFIDLAQRDRDQRAVLQARKDQLDNIEATKQYSGGLSGPQADELTALTKALEQDETTDPFFQAVADQFANASWTRKKAQAYIKAPRDRQAVLADPRAQKYGLLPSQMVVVNGSAASLALKDEERELASVCGLLQVDGQTDPASSDFVTQVALARGWYQQNLRLFQRAFHRFVRRFEVPLQTQIDQAMVAPSVVGCLVPDKDIPSRKGIDHKNSIPHHTSDVFAVSGKTIAAVVRRLVADGASPDDSTLNNLLDAAFNVVTGSADGASPSAIEIILPDLEENVDVEIVRENLFAIQAIYFSWQLEEMRMFQVVEKIVELFRQGLLPLSKGSVGDYLFSYFKTTAERITESERRDLYLRAFGAPGGNPNAGEPNRDFSELWLRFISAVSSFARQTTMERVLRNAVPMGVSQEAVRKAGRDLGTNLSRNGYGIAYFAATELQGTIIKFRDVLTDPTLRNAFGARDMWQVIDQVNANYLGGAKNTQRYRTQSRAGAIIIRWIANHTQRLANISCPVLHVAQITNPSLQVAAPGQNPTVDPTDWDLVNACEQWLAVAGVQDSNVEQYSQPIEAPTMTSRPLDMPQAARDVLASVGVNLPV